MSSYCDDVDIEFGDEFEDDRWEDVLLPDSTTVRIPVTDRFDFHDHVEVIADASGGHASSFGPMVCERREFICCLDDVYFVRREDDFGSSNEMVGRFTDRSSALASCIEASDAFVPDHWGSPCSAWIDEDDVWDIEDNEVWDPDEDDESDDGDDEEAGERVPSRLGSCRVVPNSHGGWSPWREPEPLFTQEERREHQEQLWRTTMSHSGVVIAGEGAAEELPANSTWHVIPCNDGQVGHLERVLGTLERATVHLDGRSTSAVFTDRMAPTTAARVGGAFGADEVWQLDRDSSRTIFTDPPTVVAQGLRVR
jgi:hypothetical protein